MSSDSATLDHGADAHDDDHGDHLTFKGAINIAIFLAIVTLLETLTYFVDLSASIEEPAIIVMMVIKFAVVVAYFMHLKFDNKMFTFLFMIGIVLALGVYIATLGSMEVFT